MSLQNCNCNWITISHTPNALAALLLFNCTKTVARSTIHESHTLIPHVTHDTSWFIAMTPFPARYSAPFLDLASISICFVKVYAKLLNRSRQPSTNYPRSTLTIAVEVLLHNASLTRETTHAFCRQRYVLHRPGTTSYSEPFRSVPTCTSASSSPSWGRDSHPHNSKQSRPGVLLPPTQNRRMNVELQRANCSLLCGRCCFC